MLLLVINWFFHKVYWTEWIHVHTSGAGALLALAGRRVRSSAQVLGLFLLGLSSVYREGFETVLFLQSLGALGGPRATVSRAPLWAPSP